MTRLFFDLQECGRTTIDDEGVELAGIEAARHQAVRAARAIMCDEVSSGRLCLSCCIEIRDESGCTIEKIMFKDAISITGL